MPSGLNSKRAVTWLRCCKAQQNPWLPAPSIVQHALSLSSSSGTARAVPLPIEEPQGDTALRHRADRDFVGFETSGNLLSRGDHDVRCAQISFLTSSSSLRWR